MYVQINYFVIYIYLDDVSKKVLGLKENVQILEEIEDSDEFNSSLSDYSRSSEVFSRHSVIKSNFDSPIKK